MLNINESKSNLKVIWIVSLVIPMAVAILLFKPSELVKAGEWVRFLPTLNAVLNSTTAILLITAVVAVKNGKYTLHRNLMFICLTLGLTFLVSYVIYHSSTQSVIYGDFNANGVLEDFEKKQVGEMRYIYLFVLLSHILLSIVVIPFVLMAFYRALSGRIDLHKKIVRYTFPIWLYVSITGPVVYFMIAPFYPK